MNVRNNSKHKLTVIHVIISVFITSSALANISYKKENEGIHIQGGSCEELINEVKNTPNLKQSPKCTCSENKCRIELSEILPKRMIELLRAEKTHSNDPNCFNLSEYIHGLSSFLWGSNQRTSRYYFDTELCKRVETPQFGDIGSIIDHESNEHEFTYLTPNLSITRNGSQNYQIQKTEDIYLIYGNYSGDQYDIDVLTQLEDKCINKSPLGAKSLGCTMRTDFHRCKNIDSIKKNKKYADINQSLEELAKKINAAALHGLKHDEKATTSQFNEILKKLEARLPEVLQQKYIQKHLKDNWKLKEILKKLDPVQRNCNYQDQLVAINNKRETTSNSIVSRVNFLFELLEENKASTPLEYAYSVINLWNGVNANTAVKDVYSDYISSTYGEIEVYHKNDIFLPTSEEEYELLRKGKQYGIYRRKKLKDEGVDFQKARLDIEENYTEGTKVPYDKEFEKINRLQNEFFANKLEYLRIKGLVKKEAPVEAPVVDDF